LHDSIESLVAVPTSAKIPFDPKERCTSDTVVQSVRLSGYEPTSELDSG